MSHKSVRSIKPFRVCEKAHDITHHGRDRRKPNLVRVYQTRVISMKQFIEKKNAVDDSDNLGLGSPRGDVELNYTSTFPYFIGMSTIC